jgi:hypothetical protein
LNIKFIISSGTHNLRIIIFFLFALYLFNFPITFAQSHFFTSDLTSQINVSPSHPVGNFSDGKGYANVKYNVSAINDINNTNFLSHLMCKLVSGSTLPQNNTMKEFPVNNTQLKFHLGDNKVDCIITDNFYNVDADKQFNVTVKDATLPKISLLPISQRMINAHSWSQAFVHYIVSAHDDNNNMEAYRTFIQHERDNAKEFFRINVNTAKTFEQTSRDILFRI